MRETRRNIIIYVVLLMVLVHTENYFFAPTIKNTLDEDKKLQLLSQENNGVGNLGYVLGPEDLFYEGVKSDEVTNLLTRQFSL